ncbi:DUF4292 domain-containing protein [Siphonobacter aquaeclarae]|jgi:hypothetical protein|uniref:DUF4292 domain-containing protein n=2 Tax=Bacteria TaxID=2 RepID=A0A1G9V1C9_9BACT|nr:DUF4292 domain-containing protein [Siphonobacter aquaeclarae]SDM65929.1 protein of unknown function [Siphonobacter aquaeclarae]
MHKRHSFVLVALWLLALGFTGCKRHKLQKSTAPAVTITDSAGPTEIPAPPRIEMPRNAGDEEKVDVAEIDFPYFVSRSKVSFKSKESSIDNADLNIKIRKDSLIWFNVGQFGITGARGLITRDTVTIVDVLHRSYVKFSFDTLSARFGIDLNFDLLQSIIVGNMPLKKKPRKVSKDPDYFIIRQDAGKVLVDNYIGNKDRKLRKLKAVELRTNNTLNLTFDHFTALNDYLFPYTSLITLDKQNPVSGATYQTVIELRHKKVEITDQTQTFPFSIPSRYSRKF